MSKGVNTTAEKNSDSKLVQKSFSQIKFNTSPQILACFQSKNKANLNFLKLGQKKQPKFLSQTKYPVVRRIVSNSNVSQRPRGASFTGSFNQKVVIMQYDNFDVYIDNSTRKESTQKNSKQSKKSNKKEDNNESSEDQFLQSCLKAITQQTDNTSNTYQMPNMVNSGLWYGHPQAGMNVYDYEGFNFSTQMENRSTRNRQSVTKQESKNFEIVKENIELDGRTTVMVKNIPNKYTQQMLLQEFSANFDNKFDFFYLPIDKDNDCNVGYAFVNFVSTKSLKQFYIQFHLTKWKKYKSQKICNISYARCQGTLQLADHFKHTKIIYQKDKKVKPLMGIEASRIKDIQMIIKHQKSQDHKREK